MYSGKLVRDVMNKALISVDPSTTVFQVAKMMEQGIGAILIKKDGIPAGIVTDRDYAIKIAVNNIAMDTPIEQVASFPLITIGGGETLRNAAVQMSEKKIRKLAVTENGSIVGIITSTDLVTQMAA